MMSFSVSKHVGPWPHHHIIEASEKGSPYKNQLCLSYVSLALSVLSISAATSFPHFASKSVNICPSPAHCPLASREDCHGNPLQGDTG